MASTQLFLVALDDLYFGHYRVDGGWRNVANRHLGFASDRTLLGIGLERSSEMDGSICSYTYRESSALDGTLNGVDSVAILSFGHVCKFTWPNSMAGCGLLSPIGRELVVLVPCVADLVALALGRSIAGGKLLWINRVGWCLRTAYTYIRTLKVLSQKEKSSSLIRIDKTV